MDDAAARHLRYAWPAAGLIALALLSPPAADAGGGCRQPGGRNEPPCNPALPDSPWGVSHRNSYAQASSPYPGLVSARVRSQHIDLPGIPIQIQFSDRYRDDGIAAWGSLVDAQDRRAVFKVDARTGPADRPVRPGRARGTASGQQRRRYHRLVQHPRPRRAFHRAAPARDRGLRRQPPRAAFLADRPGQAIPVARSGLLPSGRQGRRGDDDLRRLRGVRDRAGRCGDDSTPAGPDDERQRAHDQLQRRPLPQRRGPDRAVGGGLEQHRRRRGRWDLRGHLQAHAPHRPRRPAQPAHLDVERALRRRAAASRPSGSGSDRAPPRR